MIEGKELLEHHQGAHDGEQQPLLGQDGLLEGYCTSWLLTIDLKNKCRPQTPILKESNKGAPKTLALKKGHFSK